MVFRTPYWHRYNLKRKQSNLPPVSEANFKLRETERKNEESTKDLKNIYKCPYTGKVLKSKGAWESYKRSKKYQDFLASGKKRLRESPELLRKISQNDYAKELEMAKQATNKGKWQKGDSAQKRWLYKQSQAIIRYLRQTAVH